jgi:type I restriction enzyme S subunit
MADEWRETTLGEIIELRRGFDLPGNRRHPGPVPVISSSGVAGYHNEAKVIGPGVVTGRYGTLGQVFFVQDDFWPLNTTLYVSDFKGNDPRFVSYFLRGIDFLAYSDKAAVPGVNRNHLHQAPVRFPSDINEQRAIAHILGTLDDKIELNRRMSETLEEMARALFESWFVRFDPVRAKMEGRDPGLPSDLADLFPDRLMDSELGEIPEGWEVKAIGDLAEVVGGSTPRTGIPEYWEGGTHHWATPKDLSGLRVPVLLDTERKITDAGLAQISSGLLPAGTVLLSSRAPIGYLAIADVPVAVNQGFIAMKPRRGISNLFLLRWARAAHDEIVSYANGSTFLEISKASFRQIRVIVPCQRVMTLFDELSRPWFRRVVQNEHESRTLAALRDTLLPKLISGELRVKDAERLVAAAT